MASLQQLIDYLNRKNQDHGETDANVVSDINDIHNDIFLRLGRLSNNIEKYQASDTIADQQAYSLPTNCRIEDVVNIDVAIDTDDTEFETYTYRGTMDYAGQGTYYGRYTDDTFWLLKDGEPISTGGLTVLIYYYKRPTQFDSSDLSVIPELDTDYHDLLKFGIVQAMYEQGPHPDTELSDYWQAKFDKKMALVEMAIQERYSNAPNSTYQVREFF